MEGAELQTRCQLALAIRERSGRVRFRETLKSLREVENLGRQMLLVRFDDGAATFLFPHEVEALE